MSFKKNNPGCKCCTCTPTGACSTLTKDTVLTFQDTYFGYTLPAIWTPTNPGVPCGAGNWEAITLASYPGAGASCSFNCPPRSVWLRYRMAFSGGVPSMIVSLNPVDSNSCPVTGSSSGPWADIGPLQWSRESWSCGPPFAAQFGLAAGTSLYNCKISPNVRIIVGVAP